MRQVQRLIVLTLLVLLVGTSGATTQVTYPTSFAGGWDAFVGQTVTFTNDFYVCDYQGTTALSIAYRRLRTPEENAHDLAQGDSTDYFAIQAANEKDLIRLWNVQSPSMSNIRKGARIQGLTAKVTDTNELKLQGTLNLINNTFPDTLPAMGDYQLLVCASNIEHFWTTVGQMGASDAAELARQKQKISAGLVHINADIYALCELQEGTTAISALTDAMNARAGETRYAYIDNGFNEYNADMVGFIYRQDKVQPYGQMQFPYSSYSVYHYRMIVKGFKDKTTNETFVISLNHTKSKAGTELTDDIRIENAKKIDACLKKIITNQTFQDSDILLVGDYNAYSQEACNRLLVDSGWADQTLRFDSLGYSYAYGSEVGYLDRVFCSTTLAPQITAVHPYHINTDYYYQHEYSYTSDTTMCRYSDHDPILIGLRLSKATAIDNTESTPIPTKVYRNGQLLIIRENHTYTLLGQPIN